MLENKLMSYHEPLEKKDNVFVGNNCLCQYEGRSDPKVPLGPVAFAKYLAYITMEPH